MEKYHQSKHLSSHGVVQLFSLSVEGATSANDYPIPETGEELAVSAPGGVQVAVANDTEIDVSVFLNGASMEESWHLIHQGAIQVDKKGILEVGNYLAGPGMSQVPVTPGKYGVKVYTDTGTAYTASKVAFVLEPAA